MQTVDIQRVPSEIFQQADSFCAGKDSVPARYLHKRRRYIGRACHKLYVAQTVMRNFDYCGKENKRYGNYKLFFRAVFAAYASDEILSEYRAEAHVKSKQGNGFNIERCGEIHAFPYFGEPK